LIKRPAKNNNYIEIIGESGKISADKFEANEKFNQIFFDGNVKARFNMEDSN
jgi:hypothetical protein